MEHTPDQQSNSKLTDQGDAPATVPAYRPDSSWALNTLAVLAIFGSLYLASSLLLPLVLGLLLALLLSPLVSRLASWGIPRPGGAMLVIVSLGGTLVLGTYLLAAPASVWIEQVPNAINSLQRELAPITRQLEDVSEAAKEVGKIGKPDEDATRGIVQVEGKDLRDDFLEQAQAFILGSVVLLFLLYFLLAGADRLRKNTLEALPDNASQHRLQEILHRTQQQISRYLLSISLINIGLGIAVTALTWLFGLPNPLLWGVMATTLNFVPYLGPVVGLVVLTAVSVISLPEPGSLLVPGLFFLLTSLEGQAITPTVLGRNLSLNPVFVFVALIFWGWLWGVVGALVAVPIMVAFKIVCDNVPRLRPIGMVLGR